MPNKKYTTEEERNEARKASYKKYNEKRKRLSKTPIGGMDKKEIEDAAIWAISKGWKPTL